MDTFTVPDILALGFFVLAWAAYAFVLERSRHGRDSLSARMIIYREVWMRRMLDRARIVLQENRGALQAVADRLLAERILSSHAIECLVMQAPKGFAQPPPQATA